MLESFWVAWFSMSEVRVWDVLVDDIRSGAPGCCRMMMSAAESHLSLQVSWNRKEGTRHRRDAVGQGV